MNFLQLVQRLRIEAGASGSGPVSVLSQAGELARLVLWVNAAWTDIQNERQDWGWLQSSFSFVTINAQATYTPVQCGLTDHGAWKDTTFRSYLTATGYSTENYMDMISYDNWRDTYQYGSNRTTYSNPVVFAIKPADKSICLGPVPTSDYTIIGEYFKAPTELVLDADIPAMPTNYHMAIVYRALMMYGMYEGVGDAIQRGQMEYDKLMRKIRADQLPEIMVNGALA
jgi:hypothetical protein